MKLLGDDCWWAPRWMKRLQERLGLGEIDLPDERKRPAVRDAGGGAGRRRRSGAARGRCRRTTPPIRPSRALRGPAPRRRESPQAAATAPTDRRSRAPPGCPARAARAADEPPTTRLSMAKNAVRNVVNNATAATQRTSDRRRRKRRPAGSAARSAAGSDPGPRGSRDRVVAGRIARHRPGRGRRRHRRIRSRRPTPPARFRRAGADATRGPDAEQRPRRGRRRDHPKHGSRIPRRPRSSTRAAGDDERQPRRGGGVSARTCCAGKAAGSSRSWRGFDVVGLGLHDVAFLGLLGCQLRPRVPWRAAPAPRC